MQIVLKTVLIIVSILMLPHYALAGGCCSVPNDNSPIRDNSEGTRSPEESQIRHFEELFPFTSPQDSSIPETSHDVQEEGPDFERVGDINAFNQQINELHRGMSPGSENYMLSNAVDIYADELIDIRQRRVERELPPDPEIENSLVALERSEQEFPSNNSSPASPIYPLPR
ncbi:hypothetical protein C0030_001970 [Candidatus Liberibacter solanacearum]|uniref:Secreted protein n=1 Tax=Candidatus Liberibacter solanacearum TaxID=556287 RepID=A0A3R7P8K0_9HYPH|nr:hypothetical protein [Candidatus Liberibacter solanacearum]RPD37446.1 hypothetical protein C0030_001970 [Candidatus Liberibacter solanacearum]